MYSILVDNKYYRENILTPEELVTYCLLQPLTVNPINKPIVIVPESVMSDVYDNAFDSRKIKEKTISCIRALSDKKAISAEEVKNGMFKVKCFTHDKNEKFSIVNYEYIVRILKSSCKNKDKVVYFYIWLMGSCKNKIGNFAAKYFSEQLNLNINTIYSYFEILEELEIIYIKHSKSAYFHEGKYYGNPNSYCSFENKNKLIMKLDSFNSNEKRELKQKYNEMQKGKEYPIATVYQIYNYVSEHNEKQEAALEINPNTIVDFWDESVFDNYLSNLP